MPELISPEKLRRRVNGLERDRSTTQANRDRYEKRLESVRQSLAIAQHVDSALEHLSQQLFDQLVGQLQQNLTQALQEVLDHPIRLRAHQSFKHGAASVEFDIERDGHHEDIMKGQGGAVANILSVGLRLFALATLPVKKHRPFLVLDEQDCWLRPDLVPRLVRVVRSAARALGIQVIMISHHDTSAFSNYADRIYQFHPHPNGVRVELCDEDSSEDSSHH
jgi:ABC-type branched-subunit amino acid transport system ATPase component